MKILFVEPCYENFGGYFRAVGLAKALANRKIQVDLLCPSKDRFFFLIKRKTLRKNLVRHELPRWEINFLVNGRLVRGIITSLFVVFGDYDIIHTFASIQIEAVIPFFVAKVLRKKVIFDWDDYWQDSPLFHRSNKLIKKYLSFLENGIPKYARQMTVTSSFLEKEAKKLGSKKVLKIINGVDLEQFIPVKKTKARKRLKIHSKKRIILSFGNTYEGERAYLLLKTFEEILKLDGSIKLYFNLNPAVYWKEKIIKENINKDILKNIIVTGFIDLNKIKGRSYLGATDTLLFLMGNSPGEKACFPVRIGTYLNGEKVIATNRVDTQVYETLLALNCAIIGDSPADLAKKIIDFLGDKRKRKSLEKNVLKAKKKLSWNNLVVSLIDFYEKFGHPK